MELWERILTKSITTIEQLTSHFPIDGKGLQRVSSRYPMRINPYYLGLIKRQGKSLSLQAVPDMREVSETMGFEDPLEEEGLSPVPGLTHKYPDRVLFLISNHCAMYCRFCNRKRKVGRDNLVTPETIREGLSYIRSTKKIRDVLLSGGDPLLLADHELSRILGELRSIPHVEMVRIGTRVPCSLPQRITPGLIGVLKEFHPLYINTHFNHPSEITPEAALACKRLSDGGIPLGCQTVLLKGVNDDAEILGTLMKRLLLIRVRPYYLFQADLAKGTSHFWTPLGQGVKIISRLQGYLSGLGVPRFMVDLPGGGGKIPVTPQYVRGMKGDHLVVKNYQGEKYYYPIFK